MTENEIQTAQDKIIAAFEYLGDDWMQRYQYLIDLGKKLPAFPEDKMNEAHRLHGCQSQVWLDSQMTPEGRLHLKATSDSTIVCGLIALLLRIYDHRLPSEIVQTSPRFISAIGLDQHLSPNRRNGLHAMLQAIHQHANTALEENPCSP